jgi:hypothetical protein
MTSTAKNERTDTWPVTDSRQEQRIYRFRYALGHTQSPFQWVPALLSSEVKRSGIGADTRLHLVPRLRMELYVVMLWWLTTYREFAVMFTFWWGLQHRHICDHLIIRRSAEGTEKNQRQPYSKQLILYEGDRCGVSQEVIISVILSKKYIRTRVLFRTVSEIQLFHRTGEQHAMSSHELQSALMLTVEFSKFYYTR